MSQKEVSIHNPNPAGLKLGLIVMATPLELDLLGVNLFITKNKILKERTNEKRKKKNN